MHSTSGLKRLLTCILRMLVLSAIALPCSAGEAVLTWDDPARFTDIAPGAGTPKATLASVQRAFSAAFAQSAAQLPVGYTFTAEITNVDLAGQVNPPQAMDPNLISTRVLTQNYFPALTLNYSLRAADGAVLASAENVVVTDMDYLSRSTSANASTPYYYEARMIRDWFARTILPEAQ